MNGHHTIFGQVVEGQDVVKKIANAPTVADKPTTPIKIVSIKLQRVGPPPAPPAGAAKKAPAKTGVAPAKKAAAPAKKAP